MKHNDHMTNDPVLNEPTVYEVASVTVTDTVDGSVKKKKPSRGSKTNTRRVITTTLSLDDVDPRVRVVALSCRRPGQVLRVVSPYEVWVVNR